MSDVDLIRNTPEKTSNPILKNDTRVLSLLRNNDYQ